MKAVNSKDCVLSGVSFGYVAHTQTQLVSTFWVKAYKIEWYFPDADKLIDVMFLMLIN